MSSIKQGWEVRRLGDLVGILDTKRKPITKKDRNPGEFPYYGATGIVDYVDGYIFDEQLILLGEDGAKWNSGDKSAFIITGKTWVNNHAHVLKPHKGVLNDQWLVYNLNHQNLLSFVTGLTVPKLNQGQTKKIPIPVPPLKEQKQIVAKLDQAFAVIDKARANASKNLENSKQLFQSKLNEIFSQKGKGWVEKRLIDISKFIDYRGKTPKKTTEGIRLITAKNVKMGILNRSPQEFIHTDGYDDWMTRGIPNRNDVLFTTEAPLANVALLNTDERVALAQRIITLSVDQDIVSGEYLCYCMQSKYVQDKILAKGTGATVTGIKAKLLKEISIPVVDHKTQAKFVNNLNKLKKQIQSLEFKYQKELEFLEELKKSILQKAFNGEL